MWRPPEGDVRPGGCARTSPGPACAMSRTCSIVSPREEKADQAKYANAGAASGYSVSSPNPVVVQRAIRSRQRPTSKYSIDLIARVLVCPRPVPSLPP